MGTWSSHPFGNDAACDFVADFFSFLPRGKHITHLRSIFESEDARVEELVASAAIIAACKAQMSKQWMWDNSINDWGDENCSPHERGLDLMYFDIRSNITPDLVAAAAEAIGSIIAKQPGYGDWFNPEDARIWLDNVKQIGAVLNGTATTLEFGTSAEEENET